MIRTGSDLRSAFECWMRISAPRMHFIRGLHNGRDRRMKNVWENEPIEGSEREIFGASKTQSGERFQCPKRAELKCTDMYWTSELKRRLFMRERGLTIPEIILIGGTRVALGIGLGLLIADKLSHDA